MTDLETIVVGGGPAGAATACVLAAGGRQVVVLERSGGAHHKVCGEFLSIETQAMLQQLGVNPIEHGAVPIERVTVHAAGRQVTAALPFCGLSLSRLRLDHALLMRAQEHGAKVKRGLAVQSVTREGANWAVRCDDGTTLSARNLVLATGKIGLRGISDNRDGSLVGLKMHLRLQAPAQLQRRVELFLLNRSYVGVELIEDGIANLCLVMARDIAAEIGSGWPALRDHLCAVPALARLLETAQPMFDKPLAVVCPAGGHLDDETIPMVYRVGDRLAHIPPFTGDGLAIAVASGMLAAIHIEEARSPAAYLAAARALTRRPIGLASTVSRLAASRAGRTLIITATTLVPGLVTGIARRTRLPALPMRSQDVSYAAIRA